MSILFVVCYNRIKYGKLNHHSSPDPAKRFAVTDGTDPAIKSFHRNCGDLFDHHSARFLQAVFCIIPELHMNRKPPLVHFTCNRNDIQRGAICIVFVIGDDKNRPKSALNTVLIIGERTKPNIAAARGFYMLIHYDNLLSSERDHHTAS